ncbi:MAG: Mini-ribonuclease 3 [Synechococcales cyanobacterium RM1_1_8]|nr:Mini-ribonuclease 3 [Synechococcales cyanobacterium RM1_1_8]
MEAVVGSAELGSAALGSSGYRPASGQSGVDLPGAGLFGAANSLSALQAGQVPPAALAYIGDGVYELHVRLLHLHPPRRIQAYHQQVVAQVRAERQAQRLGQLMAHLTEAEQDIVRRGRNAATGRPRRLSQEVYRQATAFEALLGYLYLSDRDRLSQLLAQLDLLE